MNRIAKFSKVSYEQFKKDWLNAFDSYSEWDEDVVEKRIRNIYESIKLPKRATCGSAGYDFFAPSNFCIPADKTEKIPTGIRCEIDNGWVLKCYPRSSYGFKYGVSLSNTVGIIDEDYARSDNEGHIFIKLINDSAIAKTLEINCGDAFCQGIFIPYGITYDDKVTTIRNGGIGSTGR